MSLTVQDADFFTQRAGSICAPVLGFSKEAALKFFVLITRAERLYSKRRSNREYARMAILKKFCRNLLA
jgi:hypothetical protein